MAVPRWLGSYLKEADRERVKTAVAEAEAHTLGEIVPMIVRRSSQVGHVLITSFLFFLLLTWTLLFYVVPFYQLGLIWVWDAAAVLIAMLFAVLLAPRAFMQRLFLLPPDRHAASVNRAQLEFYLSNINATHAHTGILLFVSLLERQVVVLADPAIAAKLPESTWHEVVDLVLQGIRKGNLAEGMIRAIHKSGEILSAHFPATQHGESELPNDLVIKE